MPPLNCQSCSQNVEVPSLLEAVKQTCPHCGQPLLGAAAPPVGPPGVPPPQATRGRRRRGPVSGNYEWFGTTFGALAGAVALPLLGLLDENDGPRFVATVGGAGLSGFFTGWIAYRSGESPEERHGDDNFISDGLDASTLGPEAATFVGMILGGLMGFTFGEGVRVGDAMFFISGILGGLFFGAVLGKILGWGYADWRGAPK